VNARAEVPDTPTTLGPRVPRRGNAFWRALARLLLWLHGGWRLVGSPPDAPQFVVVAAPHTSNMDGWLLLLAAYANGFDQHWVVKHTAFKGPWAPLLRWSGAIGVNRKAAGGMVQQVLERFAQQPKFVLIVSPEGTRRRVDTWKSGFYRIAVRAKVPICLGFIDYAGKRAGFGPNFMPSGDYAKDLARIVEFYKLITPRHPELFALPTALADDKASR
jgi:1-acyl-sn-glycerol-3-phosphate acyltransferase